MAFLDAPLRRPRLGQRGGAGLVQQRIAFRARDVGGGGDVAGNLLFSADATQGVFGMIGGSGMAMTVAHLGSGAAPVPLDREGNEVLRKYNLFECWPTMLSKYEGGDCDDTDGSADLIEVQMARPYRAAYEARLPALLREPRQARGQRRV